MRRIDFVKKFYGHALKCEQETGISAVFTLAQAGLESAWGESAPGYMFFGVKDNDGINGNEQLLRTTEYSQRDDLKFPEIISITPVIRDGKKYFKYVVKDYFRRYNSPEECFKDHAKFFYTNGRYRLALGVCKDPVQFAIQVAKAGYATDPEYASKLITIIEAIKKDLKEIQSEYGENNLDQD